MPRYSLLCILSTALRVVGLYGQDNPVPLVNNPLVPDGVAPGHAAFPLTVNGTGFASNSVVEWNGSPRATTFVSASQLKAAISTADVATTGTASVTVVTPSPGGSRSNVAFFQVETPVAAAAFSAAASYSVQYNGPIITADLNGDGKLDLIAQGNQATSIAVFLGSGDGTFQSPADYATPGTTIAVAVGDFNRDGKLDVVAAENSDYVSVLLGNGDGTLRPYHDYATDSSSFGIGLGDFNGDGKLDLAVTCSSFEANSTLDILLGNGDGTFQAEVSYPLDFEVGSRTVIVADFNGDGHLDLAVAGNMGIDILLGNGDGSFGKATLIAGPASDSATLADFNGDGIPDLEVDGEGAVSILLGNGDGTFRPAVSYPVPGSPYGTVAGSFYGDRSIDLVAPLGETDNFTGEFYGGISVLRGNGDGTFGKPVTSSFQGYSGYAAVGDFNGDGKLDLIYDSDTSAPGAKISVYLQTTALISPSILSFPATVYGTTAGPMMLTITNAGAATLNINQTTLGGADAGDFSIVGNTCLGAAIPGTGNCAITVMFTPAALGLRSATITITDDALASPQIAILEGNGTFLDPSPAQLTFGSVSVGAISGYQIVTLTNTSAAAVTIAGISITGADKGDFYQFNTCEKSLSSAASCSIVVRFIPTASGTRNANIAVDQSVTGANPQPVLLSGTGT
ncbi:MAG TPA: FG-GAP-like repeat-containing protein [Bryobacteraceae bacterium]|nr:FG-GAP-like repeat-containing protein [Bryobacteraceae bacterium]